MKGRKVPKRASNINHWTRITVTIQKERQETGVTSRREFLFGTH